MDKRFKEPAVLHVHSMYSALDAVPSPYEWLEWCLENGAVGLGITDHGSAVSLYDAIRMPKLIEQYNKEHKTNHAPDAVTGIPGVEFYVKKSSEEKSHYHICAWAVTNEGYSNLMKLASLAYDDTISYFGSVKPRVTYDQILQHRAGLKFGTACIANPMGKAIMADNFVEAERVYQQYIEMFGDDLYVEFHPTDLTHNFDKKSGGFAPIPPTSLAPDGNAQKAYNCFLRDMVEKYGGKPIPVTDAHFIKPEDKKLQDCLLMAGNDNGWHFHESYYQKTADEIFDNLSVHLGEWLTPERFNSWIDNTHEIANAAKQIKIKFDYHLPKIDIPDNIKKRTDNYNQQTYYYLMTKIMEHGRWKDDPVYVARFRKEIDVIYQNKTLNFLPYFLLYEDLCAYARSSGVIQNIARGSAGGSLISYYLKIIHIDPIKNNLPFERFLSHARIAAGSFPDIDLDLSDRSSVLEYAEKKYNVGFAQIATFQKMKTKNAIKDAMWALYGKNRNDPEVKALCNTIPNSPQGVDEYDFLYGFTDKEDTYHPGQMELNEHLRSFFLSHPELEDMVKRLIGVVRGFGRHASAFVISTLDLSSERVPTMKIRDDKLGRYVTVTQFEAPMIEKSGLVKADILRVTTLESVAQCMELVRQRTGLDYREVDENGVEFIYRLPEQKAIYKDFYDKKTDSSFQFNTPLIKGLVQDFCPASRKDLSDFTALARPGALDAPFEDTTAAQYYIDVRNGRRQLQWLHPDLAEHTTNAIFCYQEEVMSFLVAIGGYTLEEADVIRGAIAKKKHEVIMATFDRIRKSCKERGWPDDAIETVCQQVQAFSKYSFNRSHSRAYSELGYITMYLKHYHPLEWWTSVLNTVDSEDKTRHFITLLAETISPPSLASPSMKFAIFGDKIAAPLLSLKGIGPASVDELVNKGPFTSIEQYVEKVSHSKVNAGHFANLVRARATDCFLDKTLPKAEAKEKMLNAYMTLRKLKGLPEDVFSLDPLQLFLMEKECNQCFNRHVLDDPDVVNHIIDLWPGLRRTGNKAIPLMIADIPILRGIDVAQGMLERELESDVGMILLYGSSEFRSGISKRTGKPWNLLSITLSDGFNEVECAFWDHTSPLRWPKNSLVYVSGTLQKGYRVPVSITVKEILKIEK